MEDGGDLGRGLVGGASHLSEDFVFAEGNGMESCGEGGEVAEGRERGPLGRTGERAGFECDDFDALTGGDDRSGVGGGGLVGGLEGIDVDGGGLPRADDQFG